MCKRYINKPDTPPSPALGEEVGTWSRSPGLHHPLAFSPLPGLRAEGGPDQEGRGKRSGEWGESAGRAVVLIFFFGFLFFPNILYL